MSECQHLWAFLQTRQKYSHYLIQALLGTQEVFFCQHNPEHRLFVPSDDVFADKDERYYGDQNRAQAS